MEKIIFNSKDKTYKNPFGALKTEEACRFCVDIKKSAGPSKVFLLYRKDEESIAEKKELSVLSENEEFIRFSCHLIFFDPGLYFYSFEAETGDGVLKTEELQLTVYHKDFKTPEWAKGGIMYQIFPDRFCRSDNYMPQTAKNERKIHEDWYGVPDFIFDNPEYKGNDYFCGNLKGITEKIAYLKNLGVSIIYLNPVFESPENHRYSTGDYTMIDPYLGTNEDFCHLCSECEKNGIKVILDGVFSHTGADSIYFNKFNHYDSCGAFQGEHSPYYNWYSFNNSEAGYECWWGFENLPNVNEKNPEYLEFITGENGVLSLWQKRGASGWRLDVADELPDEFLDALRTRVKKEDPDALIIGEVWEDATNKFAYGDRRRYLLGNQLDTVMNYPWRTAVIDYIKDGNGTLFKERILSIMENYPEPSLNCLMNILSTHDTVRIINTLGVLKEVEHKDAASYKLSYEEYKRGKDGLKAASFLQFMLPGVPSIYYGDEVGLCGFRDPYCRMCYPYGREDVELFEHFKKLGNIRNAYKTDFSAPVEDFAALNQTVMFTRGNLLIVINMGENEENIKTKSNFVTIYANGNVVSGDEEVTISPKSFGILIKK